MLLWSICICALVRTTWSFVGDCYRSCWNTHSIISAHDILHFTVWLLYSKKSFVLKNAQYFPKTGGNCSFRQTLLNSNTVNSAFLGDYFQQRINGFRLVYVHVHTCKRAVATGLTSIRGIDTKLQMNADFVPCLLDVWVGSCSLTGWP